MTKVTFALGGLGASWSIADSDNRVRLATSQQPPALTQWQCPVGGFWSNLAGLKVTGHLLESRPQGMCRVRKAPPKLILSASFPHSTPSPGGRGGQSQV